MGYTDPATIHVPSTGVVAPAAWGDCLNTNDEYFQGLLTSQPLTADSAWTNVATFTNGWRANGSFPPAFIRIGNVVYLRGALTAGTAGLAAFTLPSGYRPLTTNFWPVIASGTTINTVEVLTTGAVTPTNSAAAWLAAIAFPLI